jgi:hypothetical protein
LKRVSLYILALTLASKMDKWEDHRAGKTESAYGREIDGRGNF